MLKKYIDQIKNLRFVVNYSRMWPYVRPVWFRALCSMLICIPIGSLDAVIALALKPYMDCVINVVLSQPIADAIPGGKSALILSNSS